MKYEDFRVYRFGKWILPLWLVLGFIFIINAQNAYTKLYDTVYKNKLEEYERNVKSLMEVDKSPGLAVAFVKGSFIWSKGFGKIDIENEAEINSESLFNNRTLIRLMIAASVLQLHEEGELNLNLTLKSLLNKSEIPQNSLTIKQILVLLGQTLFTNFDKNNGFNSQENFDLSQTELNNLCLTLISLVEITSGKKFKDYLKEKIWNPLLMFSTRLEDKRSIIKNRVKSYFMNKGKINNIIEDQNINQNETLQIRTTVNDMIKFAYGFISNKLFSKIKYENLFLSTERNDKNNPINMGWTNTPVNGRFAVGFLNDKNDDNSILVVFPKDTLVIAITANQKNADLFPYLNRLFHLIMDEPYELKPYFNSPIDKFLFTHMYRIYNHGLSAYHVYGKTFTDSELDFEPLNDSLDDIENINGKQSNDDFGKNPFLTNIGCFIASSLANENGIESLQKYHQRGAIDFFSDYIKLYNSNKSWPLHLKFTSLVEETIKRWAQEWELSLNDFTSNFYIDPEKLDKTKFDKLKELYRDKKIVPNFCYDFSLATEQFSKLNKMEDAQGTGAFGIELFKTCPGIYHALGISFAWFKDADVTYDLFRMAQEFTSPEYSRVDHFIAEAEEFKTWGKIKEAISMIDRATKLDKKEPKLYSYIGDLYLEIHQITKAKRYYNKALKIDPEYEYAKEKTNILNKK